MFAYVSASVIHWVLPDLNAFNCCFGEKQSHLSVHVCVKTCLRVCENMLNMCSCCHVHNCPVACKSVQYKEVFIFYRPQLIMQKKLYSCKICRPIIMQLLYIASSFFFFCSFMFLWVGVLKIGRQKYVDEQLLVSKAGLRNSKRICFTACF